LHPMHRLMPFLAPSHDKQGTPISPALLPAVLQYETVKKVRVTLCTFLKLHFFTHGTAKSWKAQDFGRQRRQERLWEQRRNWAGATPLFRLSAAQVNLGVAPALQHRVPCQCFFHGRRGQHARRIRLPARITKTAHGILPMMRGMSG